MQFVDTISLALIFKHCPLERPQNCQHLYLKPMIEKTNHVNKKKTQIEKLDIKLQLNIFKNEF